MYTSTISLLKISLINNNPKFQKYFFSMYNYLVAFKFFYIIELQRMQKNEKMDLLAPIDPQLSEIQKMSVYSEEPSSKLAGIFGNNKNKQFLELQQHDHPYTIKINGSDKNMEFPNTREYIQSSQDERQVVILPMQNPLNENITAYQVRKQKNFTQQEIMEAFNTIDINKDSYITTEDIVFFLQYLQQPFEMEQVNEMINLLSKDKKRVTRQQFKKLARGSYIPLANYKIPDPTWKNKENIFQTIKSSQLYKLDNPTQLLKAIKKDIATYDRYEQELKKKDSEKKQKIQSIDDFSMLEKIFDIKSVADFNNRRKEFASLTLINIEEAINNYKDFQDKYIDFYDISKILEINDRQACQLYKNTPIHSKYVIMEAIAHSNLHKMGKLKFCLSITTKKKTTNFKELLHIILFLKGKDDTIRKKLLTIFRDKKIGIDDQINKYYAIELIGQYTSIFVF